MKAPTGRLLTYEEYLNYEDGTDYRHELVDGVLETMTPATGKHGRIIRALLFCLQTEVDRSDRDWQVRQSETGVQTTSRRVRIPDLCILTAQQVEDIENTAAVLQTPPPLVVEVVSPESVTRDYRFKRSEYAGIGVSEYWIVDPLQQKVSVLVLEEGFYEESMFQNGDVIASPTFPDLVLTAEGILNPN
jgi:Uma2 family endonuclease